MGTIERQTASKVESALELVLHQEGAPRDDHDLALVLALFIYARHGGENAQIVVGGVTFGDQADQSLIDVRIEPNARRGDFSIDVLVTLKSFGPHPYWIRTKEGPSSITVVKEVALLRKRVERYADREQTRRALSSLGLLPVIYDADEIERDPFALARRVIDDLSRAVGDAADSAD